VLDLKGEYWPHIVNENFMLAFFLDAAFLRQQVANTKHKNLLCVFRNPSETPSPPDGTFEFAGYDLVDVQHSASALTNCGGFPDVFSNSELSTMGLLPDFNRALEVQKLYASKVSRRISCELPSLGDISGEETRHGSVNGDKSPYRY
jgi:hypothetical protein